MPTFYANSVFGSVSPRGDLVVLFCQEYSEAVGANELQIEDGKAIVPETPEPETFVVTRQHVARLILASGQAEALGRWLQERASQAPTSIQIEPRAQE